MNLYLRTLLVFLLLLLASCASYHTIAPTSAACNLSCAERANVCYQTCRDTCQQCQHFSEQTTLRHYTYYQKEQHVVGGVIARQLNSYRDPLQCRKTTCDCKSDLNACTQSCGGTVRKQLRVAPLC